jgi:regulator of protease activity HflC (stomatin/prohibitin superfamily)
MLISIWESLIPWCIVKQYEAGCILRFGKFNRTVGPGIHLMWPFNIEDYVVDNVVPAIAMFEPQVAMTADKRPVVAKVITLWSIKDVRKALMEVEDVDTVLANAGEALCFDVLVHHTLDELVSKKDEIEREMLQQMRRKASNWGIKIHTVNFTHLAEAYLLRLVD